MKLCVFVSSWQKQHHTLFRGDSKIKSKTMKKLLLLVFLLLSQLVFAQNIQDKIIDNNNDFHKYDVSYILNYILPHTDSNNHNDGEDYELWRHYLSKPHPTVQTIRKYFTEASNEFGVPVSLLEAIGQVENNWTQIGPGIDRGWGIMHLVENDYSNTLSEAAELLETEPQILKDSAEQNIRGAAALLAEYEKRVTVLNRGTHNWFDAAKQFSGLINDELQEKQAERYYEVLRNGVESRTLWNELIILEPANAIVSVANATDNLDKKGSKSPDYPPAIWNSSTQSPNYYSRDSYAIDTWVNHWIGVGTYAGAISWFQHPDNNNSSAHFVIRSSDGEISQCVEVYYAAWHSGAVGYPANNRRSIGVEHEATVTNPDFWYSTPMLEASTTMACFFCDLYGIPPIHQLPGIQGHQEMPGCATECPGNLPWDTWMGLLTDCTNYDDTSPVTNISTVGNWQTFDFNATFTDTDNEAINLQFYQVLDFNGVEWRANSDNGFFNDNFEISINADWTIEAGTWSINNSHLNQADEGESNTNIHIPVSQISPTTYLYHWSMKISGSGTNRRAGMHFFCDDATQPNRHNSYMVYFRVDQNKAQIYKYVNDTMNLQTDDDCNVDIDTWYDYKVIFNTSTGEINAFQNDILVSSWTDPVPYISGNSISLRTGDCNVMYDDIKVYKSRGNTEIVTIGTNPGDDVRYQNQNPATAACRIKSVVTDINNNFSAIDGLDVNIDRTAPSDIMSIYDGLISDIDTTYDNTMLSANWTLSIDTNSNISHYWYCIGNSPYDSNIVAWTNNGLSNSVTHQGLSLPYDETYYFSVRAENGAGLMSNTSVSDGQLLVMPVFPPVVNFSYSDTNICDGDSVMFLNFTINATSYLWTFSGGIPAISNNIHPIVYFSSTGTYAVKLVATGPAGTDSLTQNITITVNPLPEADFYANDTLLYLPDAVAIFVNSSVNADSYFWDFGDGTVSTDLDPWHDYTQTGYYTITLIAISNNCSDDTLILYDYIYVEPESGVYELDTEFFINVYPNPNKGTFQLSFGVDMLKNVSIQVVNNLGQVVYEEVHKNFNGNYSEEIDISSLANGVYILNIKVGENTYTKNISVLR